MADNKQSGAAVGSGPTFATDEINGVDYPRTKVVWGVDGVATDVSAAAPLPVVQTGTPALPTGAATEATLSAASAKLPAALGQAAMAASMSVAIASNQSAVPVSAASLPLPSGASTEATLAAASAKLPATLGQKAMTASMAVTLASDQTSIPVAATLQAETTKVIGTVNVAAGQSIAATNAGTFPVQESGAALTALQLLDNLVLAEDAVAGSGDPGVGVLAVRRDTPSAGGADGDYVHLSTDSTGALRVTGGGGGTQYQEDAPHSSGDNGTMALGVRRDANTSLVGSDGDYAPLQLDANGSLKVAITAGAGSGGTSIADDAAFTPASTSITPVGGTYRSTLDAVDDGDAGAFAMTANRALHVNLRAADGSELAAGNQYAEDAAHTTGDLGTIALAVRRDTPAVGSGTDGDYSTLNVNSAGRLYTTTTIDAALPAGTNNIGDVDVLTVPADPFGANADAASATGSISAKLRQIAANGIPITSLPASTNTMEVVGDVAHGSAIGGNPVRIGARGMSADYTALSTGQTADLLASLLGKLVTLPYALPGATWRYAAPAGGLVNTTGVTAKAAAGAGIRNYVKSAQIMTSHQTINTEIEIRDGASGSVMWRGWAQSVGGGATIQFDPPLRGTANTLVEIAEVSATGTAGVLVNLQGYEAAE